MKIAVRCSLIVMVALLTYFPALARTGEGVVTKETVATREAVKIENLKPTHLIFDDTAYFDEKTVFVLAGQTQHLVEDYWFKKLVVDREVHIGSDWIQFFIAASSNFGLLYDIKLRVLEESDDFPAIALGASRLIWQGVRYEGDPFFGDISERVYLEEQLLIYSAYLSKTIGHGTHAHLALKRYSIDSLEQDNDLIAIGVDAKLGSFMAAADINFNTNDKTWIYGFLLRGPLEWWFRPQISTIYFQNDRENYYDHLITYGLYVVVDFPGGGCLEIGAP